MDALQIIAEPTRRQILRLIWDDELAAGEIAGHFESTFGAVSQHLKVLRDVGFVKVRREGTRRIYAANRDALAPFREILESMWADQLQHLADIIEAEADR